MKLTKAIQSHTRWKVRLLAALGGAGAGLDSAQIARDDVCELGEWLYDEGEPYAYWDSFREVRACHARFHKTAAEVVRRIQAGDAGAARGMLREGGGFALASEALLLALMRLRRDTRWGALGLPSRT